LVPGLYLTENTRLSIDDEKRSTVKSADGKGITITLEEDEIERVRERLLDIGL